MNRTDLRVARGEAERFLERLKELENGGLSIDGFSEYSPGPGKLTGAVRRASLDLTRALAKLRAR